MSTEDKELLNVIIHKSDGFPWQKTEAWNCIQSQLKSIKRLSNHWISWLWD